MRPFSLSPRLRQVADLVPPGTALADVGTDHGRLPVWLIQHGVIDRAVASDLRPGPLSSAKALAERWGLSDRVDFRLCDGLAAVGEREGETVTVAGMGGETIAHVLEGCPWRAAPGHRYILQPMSAHYELRRYLWTHGFAIEEERLVAEGETLYTVLLALPGAPGDFTEAECCAGRQSRGTDCPLRGAYLDDLCEKARRAEAAIAASARPEDGARLPGFTQARTQLEQMREEWSSWQR